MTPDSAPRLNPKMHTILLHLQRSGYEIVTTSIVKHEGEKLLSRAGYSNIFGDVVHQGSPNYNDDLSARYEGENPLITAFFNDYKNTPNLGYLKLFAPPPPS